MAITLDDLMVDVSHIDRSALLEDWKWLIGENKQPIAVIAMGNAFLQDVEDGTVWLLDAGTGKIEQVAGSVEQLKELLSDRDFVYERFLVEDFVAVREAGKSLSAGQVYGYVTPPALGGKYEVANYEPADLVVHFSVSGQIHRQVKDLPDGAKISGISIG